LEDNIQDLGVMDKLISDFAEVENNNQVKHNICLLCITSWFSKPYYENRTMQRINMIHSKLQPIA
jgi:hypothetical protein